MAQEVVHALTGMVTAVDPTAKTLTIRTDDGTEGVFKMPVKADGSLDFDKSVKAGTVPAASFTKTKTQVLVYYVGLDTERTAVAVQDLGSAPLVTDVGSVVKYSKHDHMLTVKDAKGAEQTFMIGPKTVAETSDGAVEGEKSTPNKGVQVRVVASAANGVNTALFVRSLSM